MAYQLRDSDPERSLMFGGTFCRYGHAHESRVKAYACDGLPRTGWIYRVWRPADLEMADAWEQSLSDPTATGRRRSAMRTLQAARRRREAEDRASPPAGVRSTGFRAVLASADAWITRRVRRP
jgi:hypothetical protein